MTPRGSEAGEHLKYFGIVEEKWAGDAKVAKLLEAETVVGFHKRTSSSNRGESEKLIVPSASGTGRASRESQPPKSMHFAKAGLGEISQQRVQLHQSSISVNDFRNCQRVTTRINFRCQSARIVLIGCRIVCFSPAFLAELAHRKSTRLIERLNDARRIANYVIVVALQ